MRDLLQNMLIQGAKNPLIMEMFEPLKNCRMVARYLAPQDMEIPGEAAERKVLRAIARLIQGVPIAGPQGPLPGDKDGKFASSAVGTEVDGLRICARTYTPPMQMKSLK